MSGDYTGRIALVTGGVSGIGAATAARLRAAGAIVHTIGRLGTADEIAAVIAFLGSADASFVNGSVWTADGGMASLRTPRRLAVPT
jgi:NAD(P)-dependent dehydrogenase (short-subunit alcohol dehydrogenase family)